MTEKLYDKDAYLHTFFAKVEECLKVGDVYEVVLDKTAFFPESGGQSADVGKIGQADVFDVQISADGTIKHFINKVIEVGAQYECFIDFEKRFRKMQNHTGEHIVSGIVHSLYGYDNVGFHLGSHDVTMDYNGMLNREDILKIEYLANKACAENIKVIAKYPNEAELKDITYRSKIELKENVRIVEIPGYDVCACCAPHVERTGAVGMIKLLDFIKYKGGVRVHMKCGFDALDDYNDKYSNVADISESLSVKQTEAFAAVRKLENDLAAQKRKSAFFTEKYIIGKIEALPYKEGNILVFEDELDVEAQRKAANIGKKHCSGVFAICCGNDCDGYRYILSSKIIKLKAYLKEKIFLPGGGGGSDEMAQGMFKCTKAEIEKAFLIK